MPPIYEWRCEKCNKEDETIAKFSESDVPPEPKDGDSCPHEWKRDFRHAPDKAYGANWNTRKGWH